MQCAPLSPAWVELITFLSVRDPTVAAAWSDYLRARQMGEALRLQNVRTDEALVCCGEQALVLRLLAVKNATAEAQPIAEEELAALPGDTPAMRRLEAELVVAALHHCLHGAAASLQPLVRIKQRARGAGAEHLLFRALIELSRCTIELGDAARGRALLAEVIEIARRRAEPIVEAQSLLNLGYLYGENDDAEAYAKHTQLALTIFSEQHHDFGCAMAHNNLGGAAQRLGRLDEATAHYEAAEAFAHQLNKPYLRALTLGGRAGVACARGDLGSGALLYEASNALFAAHGHPFNVARQHELLGKAQLQAGALEAAGHTLDRAESLATAGQFQSILATTLELKAQLAERQGDLAGALRELRSHLRLQRRLFDQMLTERLLSVEHRHNADAARQEAEWERQRSESLAALNADLRAALAAQTALQAQLLHASRTDPLTALSNRRHMRELIEAARPRPVSLLLLDVDHFKQINDKYGHDIGDIVLQGLAARLRAATPPGQPIARWGGEELCVALFDHTPEAAVEVAERLRGAVRAPRFTTPAGPIAVTVSIGLYTTQNPDDHINLALKRADLALYQAKRAGRDRVVCAP